MSARSQNANALAAAAVWVLENEPNAVRACVVFGYLAEMADLAAYEETFAARVLDSWLGSFLGPWYSYTSYAYTSTIIPRAAARATPAGGTDK